MKGKVLYVVIPCYNEEEVLRETTKRLDEKLNSLIDEKKISSKSPCVRTLQLTSVRPSRIISAWIRTSVLQSHFVRGARGACARGARVTPDTWGTLSAFFLSATAPFFV